MRRARVADEEASSLRRSRLHPERSRRGLRDRAGSPRAKLAVALIFAFGVYVSLTVVSRRRYGTAATSTTAAAVWSEDGGGNGGGRADTSRRTGIRRLSMFGFEFDGGDRGEWRTCRRYREDQLARHKAVSGGVSAW